MKSSGSLRAVVLALLAVLAPLALLASLVLAACSAPAPEPPADGAGPAPDLAQGDGAPTAALGLNDVTVLYPLPANPGAGIHLGAGAAHSTASPSCRGRCSGAPVAPPRPAPGRPVRRAARPRGALGISAIAPRTGPVPPRRTGGCGWCCSRSRPRARRTGRCTCSTPSPGSASGDVVGRLRALAQLQGEAGSGRCG